MHVSWEDFTSLCTVCVGKKKERKDLISCISNEYMKHGYSLHHITDDSFDNESFANYEKTKDFLLKQDKVAIIINNIYEHSLITNRILITEIAEHHKIPIVIGFSVDHKYLKCFLKDRKNTLIINYPRNSVYVNGVKTILHERELRYVIKVRPQPKIYHLKTSETVSCNIGLDVIRNNNKIVKCPTCTGIFLKKNIISWKKSKCPVCMSSHNLNGDKYSFIAKYDLP